MMKMMRIMIIIVDDNGDDYDYTAGQLKAVAQTYFKTEMGIEVRG